MPQATAEDLAWARSGTKNINTVSWTAPPGSSKCRDRIVRSQKRAGQLMSAWRKWKIRHGWTVMGSTNHGYRAYKDGQAESIVMRVFDPRSMERVR